MAPSSLTSVGSITIADPNNSSNSIILSSGHTSDTLIAGPGELQASYTIVNGSGTISYTYTLLQATSGNPAVNGGDTATSFNVTLLDSNSDQSTGALVVDIKDDHPLTKPDTDLVVSGQLVVERGDVLDGSGTTTVPSGADVLGADGAAPGGAVVGVAFGGTPGTVGQVVHGNFGDLLAIVFDFILRTVRARIIDMTGKKLDVALAADIFEHVLSIKMAQRPVSVGVLANQMRDFDSVRKFFTSGTVVSATDLLFALLFVAVLFMIAGPLAWISLVILPVMIVTGLILQRPLNRAFKRLQAELGARHGVLVESLSSIETVRAVGAETRMQRTWERSVGATARSSEDVQFWSTMSLTLAGTAQQFTSLLMVVAGVFLILDGQITMGALIAANMLAGRVLTPISGIAAVITRATQTFAALRAIDKLMRLERERPPARSYLARQINRGSIVFENVRFKYPGTTTHALDKISFSIAAGERVGIIGRVGSGKTTVGRLLTGLYEPDEGNILVEGVDLRQYDPADLRRGIGFVLQDTDLFFGKLRDNIALGLPAAMDERDSRGRASRRCRAIRRAPSAWV